MVDMEKLFGCIGIYSFLGFWWLGMNFFFDNLTPKGLKSSLLINSLLNMPLFSFSNVLTDTPATFHAAWPLSAVGIEPYFKFPSSISTWEIVIANSIFSSVISDFLW